MENNIHKGTELNNVQETWNQNEKLRGTNRDTGAEENTAEETTPATDLEQLVKQEAAEYDNENKENRLLSGDRASVRDEQANDNTDE